MTGHVLRWMTTLLAFALLAGCSPHDVSILAINPRRENFVGRYMGGGKHFAGHRGQKPTLDSWRPRPPTPWGTWARDYAGLDRDHIVNLLWSNSPMHKQDGLGSY